MCPLSFFHDWTMTEWDKVSTHTLLACLLFVCCLFVLIYTALTSYVVHKRRVLLTYYVLTWKHMCSYTRMIQNAVPNWCTHTRLTSHKIFWVWTKTAVYHSKNAGAKPFILNHTIYQNIHGPIRRLTVPNWWTHTTLILGSLTSSPYFSSHPWQLNRTVMTK